MKLSDIKGEQALDVLADIIDPISEICQDSVVVSLIRSDKRLKAAKRLCKEHKKSVLDILAYLNCESPDAYAPSLLEIPAMVLDVLNDPEFISLFSSGDEPTSSGSPTVNTEVEEN